MEQWYDIVYAALDVCASKKLITNLEGLYLLLSLGTYPVESDMYAGHRPISDGERAETKRYFEQFSLDKPK